MDTQINDKLDAMLHKATKKARTLQFGMDLPQDGSHYIYSNTQPNQKFHSTSIGKMMTAVLIFKAVEETRLRLNTKISILFSEKYLNNLFVFEDQDYQKDITVLQLLNHTSGINDYFEGESNDGSKFIDLVLNETDNFWTPEDLVTYTRDKQVSIGMPGKQFLYSDTGYILLGLIIEKVYEMPFHEALEAHIFKPIGMEDTCLSFYDTKFKAEELAPLFLNGTDVRSFTSLSCDFSGGGLCTTTQDLLKFIAAYRSFKLISQESVEIMAGFKHRYHSGLWYGAGMMQARFEGFFFLLRNYPRLQGHIGVSSTHLWYDPVTNASFVLNFGDTAAMATSFRLLIRIISTLKKAKMLS